MKVWLTKRIPDKQQFPTIKAVTVNSKIAKIAHPNKKRFKKGHIIPDAQIGFYRNLTTNKLIYKEIILIIRYYFINFHSFYTSILMKLSHIFLYVNNTNCNKLYYYKWSYFRLNHF